MKFLASLLVLSLAVVSYAAVAKAPAGRANLSVGYLNPGDRLLYRAYPYRQPVPNTIQFEDAVYRGNATTRITAVQATEIGNTQYASAWIIQGGLGFNNATVRVQSATGYGFYYIVDIWGH